MGTVVIPGKRSATRNPWSFLDTGFRRYDGNAIRSHFARTSDSYFYQEFAFI
jgi:hypothetical protein